MTFSHRKELVVGDVIKRPEAESRVCGSRAVVDLVARKH